MTKKLFTFLICVCTSVLSGTPARQHRVRMTPPDPVQGQSVAQDRLAAMLTPLLPTGGKSAAGSVSSIATSMVADMLDAAKRLIGARYRTGSSGPSAFDCSGFTSYVFQKMGISLKRSSREQHGQGKSVATISDLLPGDLVFFGRGGKGSKLVNHVGIVTTVNAAKGTFEFIHSSSSRGVRIDRYPEADYWNRHYVGARRIIDND